MVDRIKNLCYFIKLYLGLRFFFIKADVKAVIRRKRMQIQYKWAMARMRRSNRKIAQASKSVGRFNAVCRAMLAKGFQPEGE